MILNLLLKKKDPICEPDVAKSIEPFFSERNILSSKHLSDIVKNIYENKTFAITLDNLNYYYVTRYTDHNLKTISEKLKYYILYVFDTETMKCNDKLLFEKNGDEFALCYGFNTEPLCTQINATNFIKKYANDNVIDRYFKTPVYEYYGLEIASKYKNLKHEYKLLIENHYNVFLDNYINVLVLSKVTINSRFFIDKSRNLIFDLYDKRIIGAINSNDFKKTVKDIVSSYVLLEGKMPDYKIESNDYLNDRDINFLCGEF